MSEPRLSSSNLANVANLAKLSDRRSGRTARFFKRILRSRNVLAGAVVLGAVILLVALAEQISPYEPTQQFRRQRLQPPNAEFLLGTDNLGRDILTRILYGGRVSLQVGIVSVAIGATLGTLLGLIAGYIGGWSDILIMRFIDMMLAFPGILLALVIIAVLGRNLQNVMIAVGLSSIPVYTRVLRGSALSVKQFDFIVAAQALGASSWRVMARHVLPNTLAPIIVVATNGVAGAIIAGAALSFLGLGQQPPDPEWGLMLNEGRDYIRVAAWVTTYPGLAIMLTVLSINLLGDGLRDILDPRLKL